MFKLNLTIKISITFISLYLSTFKNFAHCQIIKHNIQYHKHQYVPFYNLKKLGNSNLFQGNTKKKNYFEGWYYKMVAKNGSSIISVIPGISLSKDGKEQHAFIQIINGVTSETHYFNYPIEEFSFSKNRFEIRIGDNYFSKDSILLKIQNKENTIQGKIKMHKTISYKSGSLFNPGIMGWYRFVPFMECYHGVVSLTHDLSGEINFDHISHKFDNGKGYIEKDWGSSMPSSWIWIQSNNFTKNESSFMLSVANVPWFNKSFIGFLGFYYLNDKLYQIGTYKSSKLKIVIDSAHHLAITIKNRKNTILVESASRNTGFLQAPITGAMDRRIAESIDSYLKITLLDKKGRIIQIDSSGIAGLEMVGDLHSLKK